MSGISLNMNPLDITRNSWCECIVYFIKPIFEAGNHSESLQQKKTAMTEHISLVLTVLDSHPYPLIIAMELMTHEKFEDLAIANAHVL